MGAGVAIEQAWAWLRFQPESELSQWYQERFGKGSKRLRKIGIVALARKLLIALWRYVETGLLPEGAVIASSVSDFRSEDLSRNRANAEGGGSPSLGSACPHSPPGARVARTLEGAARLRFKQPVRTEGLLCSTPGRRHG